MSRNLLGGEVVTEIIASGQILVSLKRLGRCITALSGVSAQETKESRLRRLTRGTKDLPDCNPDGSDIQNLDELAALLGCNRKAVPWYGLSYKSLVTESRREIKAANPDKGNFTGAYIMAKLSNADAQRIAVPGGDTADSMHITLGFFAQPAAAFSAKQRKQIESLLSFTQNLVPFTADAFAHAVFNPTGGPTGEMQPATVLLVQSASIAKLHDSVTEALNGYDKDLLSTKFPIFQPHLTLGYNLAVTPEEFKSRMGTLTFDEVVIGWGNDQITIKRAYQQIQDETSGKKSMGSDIETKLLALQMLVETKVRHVKTDSGAKRFKVPIGSIIDDNGKVVDYIPGFNHPKDPNHNPSSGPTTPALGRLKSNTAKIPASERVGHTSKTPPSSVPKPGNIAAAFREVVEPTPPVVKRNRTPRVTPTVANGGRPPVVKPVRAGSDVRKPRSVVNTDQPIATTKPAVTRVGRTPKPVEAAEPAATTKPVSKARVKLTLPATGTGSVAKLVHPKSSTQNFAGMKISEIQASHMRPLKDGESRRTPSGQPIPPAWKNVMVAKDANFYLQASGIDEQNKKQPVYSLAWRAFRNPEKFEQVRQMVKALPKLDKYLTKDKVMNDDTAAVVYMMRHLGVRVDSSGDKDKEETAGNTKSGKATYGASSLQPEHISLVGKTVKISFDGKKGVLNTYESNDPLMVAMLKSRMDKTEKGNKLFKTKADKTVALIRNATGNPKLINHNLRHAKATTMASRLVQEHIAANGYPQTEKEHTAVLKEIGQPVADQLNDNLSQVFTSYIDPAVLQPLRHDLEKKKA